LYEQGACEEGGGAHWMVDEQGPADASNELWTPQFALSTTTTRYSTLTTPIAGHADDKLRFVRWCKIKSVRCSYAVCFLKKT
jgi:hypothetical protein